MKLPNYEKAIVSETKITEYLLSIIAVQNEWNALKRGLISLSFLANRGFFENQVYRRAAESAEGDFFLIRSGDGDRIRTPRALEIAFSDLLEASGDDRIIISV